MILFSSNVILLLKYSLRTRKVCRLLYTRKENRLGQYLSQTL